MCNRNYPFAIYIFLLFQIAVICLLATFAHGAPKPEAQVPIAAPLPASVPLSPNCKQTVDEIEVQSCAPRAETVCETKTIINQKITYEQRCKDVTSKHCSAPAAPLGTTVLLKKREAEADPQVLLGGVHPYAAHIAPVAAPVVQPAVTTIKHACQEVTTKHCVDVPITEDVEVPVETCHVVEKVDCTPTVQQIPKVECEPVEVTVPVAPAVVNPIAYAHHPFGPHFGLPVVAPATVAEAEAPAAVAEE